MGYPDSFRIPVSDTRAYKQFGNTVVMPVFREVARVMKPWIMQQTYKPLMADMWINQDDSIPLFGMEIDHVISRNDSRIYG